VENYKSEINQNLNNFKEVCKKAGVKCTSQRMEIFSELIKKSNHPDAETVYLSVRERMPNISLDTVYRTLWLLTDIGLINTMGPTHERTRFDANLSQHHHFVCNQCGSIYDFDSKEMNKLKISEYVKNIGTAETIQVNLQGICIVCTNNEGNSKVKEGRNDSLAM
jgi:Fur family peroxide stress response transcriptional regulator